MSAATDHPPLADAQRHALERSCIWREIAGELKIRPIGGSDLLLATSDNLPGLNVVGRTFAEIEAKVPGSVRELMDAKIGADPQDAGR